MNFNFEMYNDIPRDVLRKYQVVGTPEWLSDQIVSYIPILPDATYLDPCVGRGVFIDALLKQGIKQEQITACDIVKENVDFCQQIWPKVNYRVCDLFNLTDTFDFVLGSPPWPRTLPLIIQHLTSLSRQKCILLVNFFWGNNNFKKVIPLVNSFYVSNFNALIKNAFSCSHYFSAPCPMEFSNNAIGFEPILREWIKENDLEDSFTFNQEDSVPNNLVLYSGQEYFLPINPVWHYPYLHGSGFSAFDVKKGKMSILGCLNPNKKRYGLVYSSKNDLERAREHYTSAKVKKMLVCGKNFGWKCLKHL